MMFTRRQLAGVAALGATVGLWVSPGRAYSSPEEHTTLHPCAYEDSRDCFWDARKMGNGVGRSFVNIDGHLYFLGRAR